MDKRFSGTFAAHSVQAITLCAVLVLTWGCGSKDGGDAAECELGQVSERPCGTLSQGVELLVCQDYKWVPEGSCSDDSECFGEDERAKACGINDRGRQWQQCIAGQWNVDDMCYDGDVCIDSSEKFGVCGSRNQGRVTLVCGAGQWLQHELSCNENVSCNAGETETLACGINWEGTIELSCESGSWVADGDCNDPDECINNEQEAFSCEGESGGTQNFTCLQGKWVEDHNSICMIPKVCAESDYNEDRCGLNNAGVMRQYCDSGQWGEWGDCDDPDVCVDSAEPAYHLCGDDRSGYVESTCTEGQLDAPCEQRASELYRGAGGLRIVRHQDVAPDAQGDHALLAIGDNTYQQLGLGENHPAESAGEITSSAYPLPTAIPKPEYADTDSAKRGKIFGASSSHECAIAAGELYCWGDNQHGQLGRDPQSVSTSNVPVHVMVHTDLTLVESVAVGEGFTCALTSDQEVYCWGLNDQAQLGVPTNDSIHVPALVELTGVKAIAAGDAHVCAIGENDGGETEGRLYCWGRNEERQGNPEWDALDTPTPYEQLAYFEMPPPNWFEDESLGGTFDSTYRILDIYAAGNYTLALLQGTWLHLDDEAVIQSHTTIQVAAFGHNLNGVLGESNVNEAIEWPEVIDQWNGETLEDTRRPLYLSRTTLCKDAINDTQEVECTGDNQFGQIDPEGSVFVDGFKPVIPYNIVHSIAVLDDAICVIGDSGGVYCRGSNKNGQLGNGTANHEDNVEFNEMLHVSAKN